MACFVHLFRGLKSWLAIFLPLLALFARFSSGHGSLLISITFYLLVILFSTLFLFTFSKQKYNLIQKEALKAENEFPPQGQHQTSLQQKTLFSLTEKSHDKVDENASERVMRSQDLYSESESMEQFSSEEEEDHSSEQTPDYSDGSISDEESLIEIAIPSGQFVKDFNLNYCKLSAQHFSHKETMFQKYSAVDYLAGINEMNEEDNLIEIDIYMGSIKCSTFQI